MSADKSVDGELASVAFIHEMAFNLGINETVINVIDTTINNSMSLMSKSPDLADLLTKIIKKQNFIYEHSLLTSYVAGAIAIQMSWQTNATLQKLSIAALLHDVSLEAIDDFDDKKIEALDNLNEANLDRKEKQMIRNHPAQSAEMIKNNQFIPPNTDWIIRAHHEKPDGSGFPNGLDAISISPLAALFILAETFSRKIYRSGINPLKVQVALREMKEEFNRGNFTKPLEGLIKIFDLNGIKI
jgi:HD-GYP domain-containing protein (c-di-GMP phosphodiesterase class II)